MSLTFRIQLYLAGYGLELSELRALSLWARPLPGTWSTRISPVDINCRAAGRGWHIQLVHWTRTGRYIQDADDLLAAIEAAKAESGSPSIVVLRSIIASPLAAEEVAATKRLLGFDPERDLVADDRVLARARKAVERGRAANQDWQKAYDVWRCEQPDNAELPTVWAKAVIEHEDAPGRVLDQAGDHGLAGQRRVLGAGGRDHGVRHRLRSAHAALGQNGDQPAAAACSWARLGSR